MSSELLKRPPGVQWVKLDSLISDPKSINLSSPKEVIDAYSHLSRTHNDPLAMKLAVVLSFKESLAGDTLLLIEAAHFEKWLEAQKDIKFNVIRAIGFQVLAERYWKKDHLAEGLEYYIRAFELYRHFSPREFPRKSVFWFDYSNKYYYFRDFRAVKDLLLQMVSDIPVEYLDSETSFLNTLAMSYRQLSQLDSSDHYFHQAMDRAQQNNDKVWMGIIRGNQAQNLVMQGRYDEAIPLLESNIASSRAKNVHVDLAYALSGMAEIHLIQNKPKEALKLVQEAVDIMKEQDKLDNKEIKVRLYIPLGKALMANGQPEEGFMMLDEGRIAQDSVNAQRNALLLTGVKMKLEAESHLAAINTKEAEIKMSRLWNAVLVLILLGISAFTFVFFRQKKRISQEKRRSDALLLNILPVEVANDLKQKGRVEARHFKEVTILFTDFRDFTQWVERHSPDELVADLDFCFRTFDEIITRHGLEKIKTIGDAYMAVAGLPQESSDHALCAVKAAMEIRDFIDMERKRREEKGGSFFEIRIGLHTGAVVAGVIGLRKFTYDIWGDTVNIAARMESSGETGKVNVSEATFNQVSDYFSCIFRGRIPAKHKGEIGMYFVEQANVLN